MLTRLFSPVRNNYHSFLKRSFCTCFTVNRQGIETTFTSPHTMSDAIAMASSLSSRSEFLQDILKEYNEKGTLNSTQENWIRFFVYQDEQIKDSEKAGWKEFTVSTKKGEITFTTELSLEEAASLCRQKQAQNEFSASLLKAFDEGRLSVRQMPWLYKLAQEELERHGVHPANIPEISGTGPNGQTKVEESPSEIQSFDDRETSGLNKYSIVRQGRAIEFETKLSEMEAVQLIRKDKSSRGSKFRDELVEKYVGGSHLSQKQLAWIMYFGYELEKKHKRFSDTGKGKNEQIQLDSFEDGNNNNDSGAENEEQKL